MMKYSPTKIPAAGYYASAALAILLMLGLHVMLSRAGVPFETIATLIPILGGLYVVGLMILSWVVGDISPPLAALFIALGVLIAASSVLYAGLDSFPETSALRWAIPWGVTGLYLVVLGFIARELTHPSS